jgi:hypothetical protein
MLGLWLVTIGFNSGDSIAAIVLGGFLAYLSFTFSYLSAIDLTQTPYIAKAGFESRKLRIIPMIF